MVFAYINPWHALIIHMAGALCGLAVFVSLYKEKLMALREMEARELAFDLELSRQLATRMALAEKERRERTQQAMLNGDL